MTCKDCIHSGVCYKENDYDNFPDRCGEFISDKALEEKPQGEWIEMTDNYGHSSYFCSRCGTQEGKLYDVCPNCKADMRKRGEEE